MSAEIMPSGFYNMDCMDAMKRFPDGFFDLAIVDPPYGNGGGYLQEEKDLVSGLTATEKKVGGGIHLQKKMSGNRTEVGVTRTGGTWAEKFRKKLLSGTLRRGRTILKNFSASHETRLSGAQIISECHQAGTSLYGTRSRFQKIFQWQVVNMLG